MISRRLFACLLLLMVWGSAPIAATDGTMALGADGEIYRVLVGVYGELIADPPASQAENPVVVLERTAPGASPVRMLVPGTGDAATEKYPSLALDPRTHSVVVVWEARATIHSTLHVATLGDEGWSNVFDLYGDGWSEKLNPRVATTTDSYRALQPNGEAVERTRMVIHLVWFDSGSSGQRALYIPLVFEDGLFSPNWSVLDLQAFLEEASPATGSATLPAGLHENPVVEASRDGSAAILAFVSPASGRLATVESRPVSGGLVSWADEARNQILDSGRTLTDRRAIADKARNEVIDTARRLLASDAADLLATKFLEAIALSDPAESLTSVVDKARNQILDSGVRLDTSGTRVGTAKVGASRIAISDNTEDPELLGHLAVLSVAASWPAPWLPNRVIRLVPSGDGENLGVAWDLDNAVKYRLTQGVGWSDVRTLAIGADLTRERAYELIDRRLNRR